MARGLHRLISLVLTVLAMTWSTSGQADDTYLADADVTSPNPPEILDFPAAMREMVEQIRACWMVDPGSEAAHVTVTVGFELGRDGKAQGEVRQIGGSGGSDAAINTAFGAARRAILRCQQDGFRLPADKYDQWQSVEMTFDPNGMRLG